MEEDALDANINHSAKHTHDIVRRRSPLTIMSESEVLQLVNANARDPREKVMHPYELPRSELVIRNATRRPGTQKRKLGLCITGQMSRLLLQGKWYPFLRPMLVGSGAGDSGVDIHLHFVLGKNSTFSSPSEGRKAAGNPWMSPYKSEDDIVDFLVDMVMSIDRHHHSTRGKLSLSFDTRIQEEATVRNMVYANKSAGLASIHARILGGFERCGMFYANHPDLFDGLMRLRDDGVFTKEFTVPESWWAIENREVVLTPDCWNWGGVNDRTCFTQSLRSFFMYMTLPKFYLENENPEYRFEVTEHGWNMEVLLLYSMKQSRVPFRRVCVDEYPHQLAESRPFGQDASYCFRNVALMSPLTSDLPLGPAGRDCVSNFTDNRLDCIPTNPAHLVTYIHDHSCKQEKFRPAESVGRVSIRGNAGPLEGSVLIGGSHSKSMPMLASVFLFESVCVRGISLKLSDTHNMIELIRLYGAEVKLFPSLNTTDNVGGLEKLHDVCVVPPSNAKFGEFIRNATAVSSLKKIGRLLRSSVLFLGPLIARYGEAVVAMPDRDDLGDTSFVDQHLNAFGMFEGFGANFSDKGMIWAKFHEVISRDNPLNYSSRITYVAPFQTPALVHQLSSFVMGTMKWGNTVTFDSVVLRGIRVQDSLVDVVSFQARILGCNATFKEDELYLAKGGSSESSASVDDSGLPLVLPVGSDSAVLATVVALIAVARGTVCLRVTKPFADEIEEIRSLANDIGVVWEDVAEDCLNLGGLDHCHVKLSASVDERPKPFCIVSFGMSPQEEAMNRKHDKLVDVVGESFVPKCRKIVSDGALPFLAVGAVASGNSFISDSMVPDRLQKSLSWLRLMGSKFEFNVTDVSGKRVGRVVFTGRADLDSVAATLNDIYASGLIFVAAFGVRNGDAVTSLNVQHLDRGYIDWSMMISKLTTEAQRGAISEVNRRGLGDYPRLNMVIPGKTDDVSIPAFVPQFSDMLMNSTASGSARQLISSPIGSEAALELMSCVYNKENPRILSTAMALGFGTTMRKPAGDVTWIKLAMKGIYVRQVKAKVSSGGQSHIFHVTAYAGEMWKLLLREMHHLGLCGLETFGGIIEDTVGTAAIGNVTNALGETLSQFIVSVRAFDFKEEQFVDINARECMFGRRFSVFQRKPWLIVTRVTFELIKSSCDSVA